MKLIGSVSSSNVLALLLALSVAVLTELLRRTVVYTSNVVEKILARSMREEWVAAL